MKVIIAGGRTFNDYNLLKTKCDFFLKNHPEAKVITGCAKGADSFGEIYARHTKRNIICVGTKNRYLEMAQLADCAIFFWDGHSKGTQRMIQLMKSFDKPIRIIYYDHPIGTYAA